MHCPWTVSLGRSRPCSFTPSSPHILLPLSAVVLCQGGHPNCPEFIVFRAPPHGVLQWQVQGQVGERDGNGQEISFTPNLTQFSQEGFLAQLPVAHLSCCSSLCMLFEEPRVGKARGGRLEENLGATGPARVYSLWAGAAAVWQACCILLCLTQ